MLWMEDVRRRRVVNDNGLAQVTANLGEILDIVALMVVTTFSEKAMVHNIVDIKLVK